MAITEIYGFQNFKDVVGTGPYYDFTPFGKLPFRNSMYEYTDRRYGGTSITRFSFNMSGGRVWLRSDWGTKTQTHSSYSNTRIAYNLARQPRFNLPIERVFGGHLDDTNVQRFIMGFRYRVISSSQVSRYPLSIVATDSNNDSYSATRYNVLLENGDIPKVSGADIYVEIEFDFETRLIRRWIDSVRVSDIGMDSAIARGNFKSRSFEWGDKLSTQTYTTYDTHFALNDFYFMADTSHKDDGLPSRRLGPIEVDALVPEQVVLPETWENETELPPEELLQTTHTSTNVRNVKGLVSDSAGDRATVGFVEPDIKDGEVIYCELDLYGYREHGEHVAINTQAALGDDKLEEKQFVLLPDSLRTMDDAIKPAKLHRAPNGEPWSEKNLGKLTLDIWSSKPE